MDFGIVPIGRATAALRLSITNRLGTPPKWQWRLLHQPGDEPPHTVVARRAFTVVFRQVLVDSTSLEALFDFRQDEVAERLALAAARSANCRSCRWARWLVLSLRPRHVLADRFPVDAQEVGDFAVAVFGCVECKDSVDLGHRESVRHQGFLQQGVC